MAADGAHRDQIPSSASSANTASTSATSAARTRRIRGRSRPGLLDSLALANGAGNQGAAEPVVQDFGGEVIGSYLPPG